MSQLLCLGAGYSARTVIEQLMAEGWSITGTTRSTDGADRLRAMGVTPLLFDGTSASEDLRAAVREARNILVSIAPDADASPDACDPVLRELQHEVTQAPNLRWIGYLSTVGVYGDYDGAWVDEETNCRPVSRRSIARVAAEQAWSDTADAASAWRLHIYRLSGIYGPGRNPIARLKAGTSRRIIKAGQVFNRIHVADIAQAIRAGLDGRGQHRVYNVTDDEPTAPQTVISYAAMIKGLPVPPDLPFETADLTPMARSFYGENKRVRNRRLRDDLGVDLIFPNYRVGLQAIAQAE